MTIKPKSPDVDAWPAQPARPTEIVLVGQCVSGKNAVRMTRTGRHYPQARFKEWRENMTQQLKAQGIIPPRPIPLPCRLRVHYWAGDRRTRDVSGLLDAIFHLLGYVGILKDDGQIRDVLWYWQGVERTCPRVEMHLEWMG